MDIKIENYSTDFDESIKKEEFCQKIEEDFAWNEKETGLSSQSKKINKKRKKYQKIDNETRLKIIEEVQKNGKLLKNAAEKYNVNYSSAKSIFHVYRKEGRILKKPFKGRTSKTVYHMTNPIVFVNIPPVVPSFPVTASNTDNQRAPVPLLQEYTSIQSMPFKESIQQEPNPQLLSLLHPTSASMLQNIWKQPDLYQKSLPLQQSFGTSKKIGNEIIEKRWDQIIETTSIIQASNYPVFAKSFHESQSLQQSFLPGFDFVSPVNETLKKASLLNYWAQNQLKVVGMGP